MMKLAGAGIGGLSLFGWTGCGSEPMDDEATPWWLAGNYAPIDGEIEAFDLAVTGQIPRSLNGLYLRNGPNPPSGKSLSWFFGDGMAHGVWLEDGKARAYRNRYVRTTHYNEQRGYEPVADLAANLSNTAYVHHAGRLLSLYEGGRPYVLSTEDLSTVGDSDFSFDDKLLTAMTAHPKVDRRTDELHFFGYGPFEPYMTYHVVDASGALVRSVPIDLANPVMMHDFQLTERFVIVFDLPVLFDLQAAADGGFPFEWRPSVGSRFGVMPRDGETADIRWFDVDTCYMFHTVNAYEVGDRIEIIGSRHDHMWAGGAEDQTNMSHLYRWSIDLASETVTQTQLDDRIFDFPQANPAIHGRESHMGYGMRFAPQVDPTALKPIVGVMKYDTDSGSADVYDYPDGFQPDEHVFAPDPDGDGNEDDGYLISYVYDKARDGTDLAIIDARDVMAGPVATIALPRRVPFGFHGKWVPT
jgi:carotenoid cleavage dioxygenase